MEYEINENKPERLLLGYVTLRGPDLEQVYRFIESKAPCTEEEFVDELFIDDGSDGSSHHEECLRFLRSVDMVKLTDDRYDVINEQILEDQTFGLKLLHHLHEQTGRQTHVTFIIDLITKKNLTSSTQSELIKTIERSEENVYEFTWTDPKIKMWSYLLDFIGVIQMESEEELTFYPRREFVIELLKHYSTSTDQSDLSGFLEYINNNYWNCFTTTSPPTIHQGLSAVLINLAASGIIELHTYSDATEIRLQKPEGEGYENYTNFSTNQDDETSVREVS